MDFDTSKENIQPLRGGRNIAQLGMALQAQNSEEYRGQLNHQKEYGFVGGFVVLNTPCWYLPGTVLQGVWDRDSQLPGGWSARPMVPVYFVGGAELSETGARRESGAVAGELFSEVWEWWEIQER